MHPFIDLSLLHQVFPPFILIITLTKSFQQLKSTPEFMTFWHIATQVPTGKNTFLDGKINTYLSVALTSWPCMSERHVFCCRKGCKVSFPRLPRLLPKRFRNSFSRFIFRFSCHDMNKSGMGHLSLLLAAASFWSGKYQGVGILGYPCAGDVCTYGLIKREGSSKRWASKKFPGTRNRLVNNGFLPSGWNEDPEAPEGIMWIVLLNWSIKNFTLIGLGGHAITGKNAWNELVRMDYELSSLSCKSYCSFLSLMQRCLFVMQCWVATFSCGRYIKSHPWG